MIPTTDRKQNPLASLVVDYGISGAAKKLGYSYAYIHMVHSGKMKLTTNMKKRIIRLNLEPRHLCAVNMKNEEDKRKVQKLSMNTRRRALLKEAKRRIT